MYFTLSQHQYLILTVFGGLLFIQVLVLGYWSYRLSLARRDRHEGETDETEEEREFPDRLREGSRPVPLFIVLLTGAVLIWGVLYVIAVAVGGLNVQ